MEIKAQDIKIVDVTSIKPHPKNPHLHTPDQIERLAEIIQYQGFRVPIVVDKKTNYIAAGHGRVSAALKLGLKKVPVVYQEFENDDQLYAFIVSDNAIGKDDWAKLDMSQINLDLKDLGPDLDIDMLGLRDFELDLTDKYDLDEPEKDNSDKEQQYKLQVTLSNELDLRDLYDDLASKGYLVKIL